MIFYTIGKGWCDGLVPYADLFDHKGPLQFAIYAAALSISTGKTVVWIFEVIFFTLSIELLYRCGKNLNISDGFNYLAIACVFILFCPYADGGAGVEEFSLPFQIVPLWALLRRLKNCRHFKDVKLWDIALLAGICFGLTSMIRVNNNLVISGICLSMLIALIYSRQYGKMVVATVWFIAGGFCGILPFVIYFVHVGAFDDFIYGTFLYNLKYLRYMHDTRDYYTYVFLCVTLLPSLILLLQSIRALLRGNNNGFDKVQCLTFGCVAFVTVLVLGMGGYFRHYLLMSLPADYLFVIFNSRGKRLFTILSLCIVVLLPVRLYAKFFLDKGNELRYKFSSNWTDPVSTLVTENVPADERDNVYYCCQVPYSGAYELANMRYYPKGRFFFLQDKMCIVSSDIRSLITSDFVEARPKWIVLEQDIAQQVYIPNPQDYILVATLKAPGFDGRLYKKQ